MTEICRLTFYPGFDTPGWRLHPTGTHITHMDADCTFKKSIIFAANTDVKYQQIRIRSHRNSGADIGIPRLCRFGDNPLLNSNGKRNDPAISLPPGAGGMKGSIQDERRAQLSGFFDGVPNYRSSKFCDRSVFMNNKIFRDILIGRTKRDKLAVDLIRCNLQTTTSPERTGIREMRASPRL